MAKHCVALVDSTRARFLTVEAVEARGEETFKLREHRTLMQPEQRLRSSEILSDSLPTGHSSPGGGPSHTYDDHRVNRRAEVARRFSNELTNLLVEECTQHGASLLTVAASPKMLGELRPRLQDATAGRLALQFLDRDLTRHSEQDVYQYLVQHGLLTH